MVDKYKDIHKYLDDNQYITGLGYNAAQEKQGVHNSDRLNDMRMLGNMIQRDMIQYWERGMCWLCNFGDGRWQNLFSMKERCKRRVCDKCQQNSMSTRFLDMIDRVCDGVRQGKQRRLVWYYVELRQDLVRRYMEYKQGQDLQGLQCEKDPLWVLQKSKVQQDICKCLGDMMRKSIVDKDESYFKLCDILVENNDILRRWYNKGEGFVMRVCLDIEFVDIRNCIDLFEKMGVLLSDCMGQIVWWLLRNYVNWRDDMYMFTLFLNRFKEYQNLRVNEDMFQPGYVKPVKPKRKKSNPLSPSSDNEEYNAYLAECGAAYNEQHIMFLQNRDNTLEEEIEQQKFLENKWKQERELEFEIKKRRYQEMAEEVERKDKKIQEELQKQKKIQNRKEKEQRKEENYRRKLCFQYLTGSSSSEEEDD